MKKSLLMGLIALIATSLLAVENPVNSILATDNARLWFYTSAEKKIFYQQIFSQGLNVISDKVEEDKLKKGSWGVVFALDNTLIEHSWQVDGYPQKIESEPQVINLSATPGAKFTTCEIQKLGGKVIIISNRYLLLVDMAAQIQELEGTLAKLNICYDNIIFAKNSLDSNKNPRFTAVATGDYEGVISSKKLPALNVIAYFGSDIIDFPNFKQNTAAYEAESSDVLASFGESYFLLPNPVHGSFETNRLKIN